MIPKTIHYCWFGGKAKGSLFEKCIRSWKKYCPDYEIIEWNEDNFDINYTSYTREAYAAGKWAFVSDVARLWIVFNNGGIYLDCDVELKRPLDELLFERAYFGVEESYNDPSKLIVSTGLGFGAEKGNPIVKMMLDDYGKACFLNEDGTYDTTPCPKRNTKSIKHLIPSEYYGEYILDIKDAKIFPKEYFCPLSTDGTVMNCTKETYSVHLYSASWLNDDERVVHQYRLFQYKCCKLLGKRAGSFVARCVYLFKPKQRAVLKRM